MNQSWASLLNAPGQKEILQKEILREKAERSQPEFIRQAWPILEPAREYVHSMHIDLIGEYLQAVLDREIKRLVINIPPRCLKSKQITVAFPVWAWIRNPALRFIKVSYAATLSKKHNVLSRDIVRSPWYKENWGDRFHIADDTDRQDEFKNNHQGFMFATSTGGTITGEGGDIIILDDPQNPKEANSEAERQNTINFFTHTLPSRLDDPKTGVFIVVMQRLHEEDLTGYILAEDLGYEYLRLPAEAEKRTIIQFPKSKKIWIREEGDILSPGRFTKETLETTRKTMGSAAYGAQYGQDPLPAEGEVFKRSWLSNTYRKEAKPKTSMTIQTWDLPFKASEGSAECAGLVLSKSGADILVEDLIHDKMEFTETITAIKRMSAKHPKAAAKVIEDKANGPAVIDHLRRTMSGLIRYEPVGSKEERAISVTPYFEAGNILFPEDEPWVQDIIEQLISFPNGRLKDIVDALVQGILYLMNKTQKSLPQENVNAALTAQSYWRR